MCKRKVPPDEILIKLRVEQQLTGREIAEMYGVTGAKVYRHLHRLGLSTHLRYLRHPKKPIPLDELKKLYVEERKSSVELGKMFNVGACTICNKLRPFGIIRPKNQRDKRKCKPLSNAVGYSLTYLPSHSRAGVTGYVFTHILEVEKHTGIIPSKDQPIHHIDFDRSNNNIANLYVCSSCKEHLQIHGQLKRLMKDLFRENLILFIPHVGYCINPKVLNSKQLLNK